MGGTEKAARDPIFWLHHCNIDRLWAVWRNQDAAHHDPSDDWLNQDLELRTAPRRTKVPRIIRGKTADLIRSARPCPRRSPMRTTTKKTRSQTCKAPQRRRASDAAAAKQQRQCCDRAPAATAIPAAAARAARRLAFALAARNRNAADGGLSAGRAASSASFLADHRRFHRSRTASSP